MAKKIVRLTESDLNMIIKRIIKEQEPATKPITKPITKPKEKPFDPYNPNPVVTPKPMAKKKKAHKPMMDEYIDAPNIKDFDSKEEFFAAMKDYILNN
jgi:hypothetical protein